MTRLRKPFPRSSSGASTSGQESEPLFTLREHGVLHFYNHTGLQTAPHANKKFGWQSVIEVVFKKNEPFEPGIFWCIRGCSNMLAPASLR